MTAVLRDIIILQEDERIRVSLSPNRLIHILKECVALSSGVLSLNLIDLSKFLCVNYSVGADYF